MTTQPNQTAATAWVKVVLRERKVVDVDGDVVSLEFTLGLPEDKAWYQCFAQASGPPRTGSTLFTETTPQFLSAEVLSWKITLNDIPQAAIYLAERVTEANDLFVELLKRKEQIRRQLEEAARQRTESIQLAQSILDASWPAPPETETPETEANVDPGGDVARQAPTPWSTAQPQGSR